MTEKGKAEASPEVKAHRHAYYLKNKARILANSKRWQKQHPGYSAQRHSENPGRSRAYYEANRELILEQSRTHYRQNPESRRGTIAASKRWYAKNKDTARAKAMARYWLRRGPREARPPSRRFQGTAYIESLKLNPCTDCGKVWHIACMDFDHMRGKKKHNIALMAPRGMTLDAIKEELALTELVCVHCRKIRGIARRNSMPKKEPKRTPKNLANRAYRARAKAIVDAEKDAPCTDCKKKYDSELMEFDHVSGTKTDNVARMVTSCSIDAIRKELLLCELVCARCHRIRTWERYEAKRAKAT